MNLDDIRDLLYSFTDELATYIEENGAESLYEDAQMEELVEDFLDQHSEMLDAAEDSIPEESY